MAELHLSGAARRDLVEIRVYSNKQFGGDAADAYFLGLDAGFDMLQTYPRSGALTPELGSTVRCLVHRRHRIFYELTGDDVLILRVLHHTMDARLAFGIAGGH